MAKAPKLIQLTLQVFGVISVFSVSYLAYAFKFSAWEREDITHVNQINGELIRAGLEIERDIKVISGSAYYHNFLSDYERKWCAQLDSFEILKPLDTNWYSLNSSNLYFEDLLRTDLRNTASTCFGSSTLELENLRIFILGVRTMEVDNETSIDGFEAMIFDPQTLRVAFYGHQL